MIKTANRINQVEEYYFSKKLAEVRSLDRPGFPVINLGIGSPDLAPSPSTILALAQSAQVESHHGYQNYKGIPALRSAIASYYQATYGVSLDAETDVLPLMGSKEGIFHISMAFVNEGDQVLIPDPGYPTYASAARLVGGEVRTYVMKESLNWGIDIDELQRQDLSRVKIMWINFPHMPTGRVATREELTALVALARRHNFLLVNDNPYSRILNDSPLSVLSVPGAAEIVLELNSLSKSHNMAGWRIGWVAGRREYIGAVLRVKSNLDSGMFLSLQHAAVEALKSGPDWFEKLNDEYKRRRETAQEILHELGCTAGQNQSGLFLWAKAPSTIVDVEAWVDEILYGARVFVTPGSMFGATGLRHVRLSLCAPKAKLREALRRIQLWMKGDSIEFVAAPLSPGEGSGMRPEKEKEKSCMNICIVGLGLIGGSVGLDLHGKQGITRRSGVDINPDNVGIAVDLGLVDAVEEEGKAFSAADVVLLAIPVNSIKALLPQILDSIPKHTVVIDLGSTKSAICQAVTNHSKRAQFVAAHPVAGTENSGPTAAVKGLFQDKVNIVCERERSGQHALTVAEQIFSLLGLQTIFMGPEEHDKHVAYVSHLSHVSSFLLGQTVLDIEKEEKHIFNLAGSGFASTVRLAKSSSDMWTPIFEQNAEFLGQALSEYIMHLQRFQYHLMKRNTAAIHGVLTEANKIRRVLDRRVGTDEYPIENSLSSTKLN